MDQNAAVEWARTEAGRLRSIPQPQSHSVVTAAVEFLRLRAPRTAFYRAASSASGSVSYIRTIVVEALESWASFVEDGLAESIPYERRYRIDAATDLMEQVTVLLQDKRVHPAVPVMLAGAALEEVLRSLYDTSEAKLTGVASIAKYGEALKAAGVIDKTDAHQVTSMAATRNAAAHGEFDKIDLATAEVFAQRVNLFLAQHSPRSDG